jgi:hypothetical protein
MAEYKGIKGFKVQSLASDPSPAVVGQVWYNTAGSALKYTSEVGAWASGGNLNTGRDYGTGTGTNTAGLFAGGSGPITNVESYDGSAWTELSANLNTGRRLATGQGTQTASFFAGGDPITALNETWNGTSWTEVNDLNTARYGMGGAGTSTAALAIGGAAPGNTTAVESWNGTSWTTSPATLNTARHYLVGFGTTTAAIAATGNAGPYQVITESFDGSTWTEVADVPTSRQNAGASGIQTNGIMFGGETDTGGYAVVATTNTWDGTSWAVAPGSLATARYGLGLGAAVGTASATMAIGGTAPPSKNLTEEWSMSGTTKTVTTS